LNYIGHPLGHILRIIYQLVGNYGFAIILFTLMMKLLMVPLALRQTRSMSGVQSLQPEIKALQEKYKNDQEKLNEKTMDLYKEQKVNPLGGCLPLLIQMPIILGLFTVLRSPEVYVFATESIHATIHTQFFWVKDLLLPDPWMLPLMAGVTTYLSSITVSSATQNKSSSGILPVAMSLMIFWWGRSFPAGLTLYWVTSNLFQVFQQRVLTSQL